VSGKQARRYIVRGRVQGVGFRWFVEKTASMLGIRGYVKNLDDGNVEVYAIGAESQLTELLARLWKGPRLADVRGVEEQEAEMLRYESFFVAG
jgi:acylphosphatase